MMARRKISFVTLGCPKNLTDSEYMHHKLQNSGYDVTPDNQEADVILVNTCGFIEDAKKESIENIIAAVCQKKDGSIRKVVVTGCLVERYPNQLKKEIPEVDAFVHIKDYPHIAEHLHQLFSDGASTTTVPRQPNRSRLYADYDKRILLTPPHFAYLKISDGCNHRCGFCVIPQMRGRHVSRDPDHVVQEANVLAKRGIKEIILIAQDSTYYGHDLKSGATLSGLLRRLVRIRGIEWIRILYAYPTTLTDEMIDVIAQEEKICKYIDMPLQHASDRILKSMRRGYCQRHIDTLLEKIRKRIPDVTIRTTFIVGYPGETRQDFATLRQWCQDARFDRLGVFLYSDEETCHAYGLEKKVTQKTKQHRQEELMSLQKDISYANNQRKIGKTLRVLVDEVHAQTSESIGRTQGDAPEVDQTVVIQGAAGTVGDFVQVKINDALEYDLLGVVV